MGKVKELLAQGIERIREKELSSCVRHAIEIKDTYWKSAVVLDTLTGQFVIDLRSDNENTGCSETDTATEGEV